MSDYKIWIARDQDEEDEDYNLVKRGKLHMFYDSPELLYNQIGRASCRERV